MMEELLQTCGVHCLLVGTEAKAVGSIKTVRYDSDVACTFGEAVYLAWQGRSSSKLLFVAVCLQRLGVVNVKIDWVLQDRSGRVRLD